MVVVLDDARLPDVAQELFGLATLDASTSRLLVRRLARANPPDLPAAVVASAPFAGLVLAETPCEPSVAAALAPLRAAYTNALAGAGILPETRALAVALERLDDPGFAPPAATAVVADGETFARGARRTFAERLAARFGVALEWRARAYSPAAPATRDALVALLRWAVAGTDEDARRVALSALSPLGLVDARALIVAAGTRATLAEAIGDQRLALSGRGRAGAQRLLALLEAVRTAYRAQGARAAEVVATVVAQAALDAADLALLEDAARIARALDRVDALAGSVWDAGELAAALDDELPLRTVRARVHAPRRAVPAHPLEPAVLPPRRGHFSASSLNTFAECPRKWFYRYLCAAVQDRGSAASFYGTAFHSALESFHVRWPRLDGLDPAEIDSRLVACIAAAFERYRDGFESNVEYELQRRRSIRTVRKYGEWLVARAREAPFTVVGCEISTELVLDGYDFVGFIDRLDRDERSGGVTVVDYKTGTIATTAAEYRDKVLRFADFQLPFYYWARTAAGDRVTRLALLPLKDATADVVPVELEVVPVPVAESGRGRGRALVGTISIAELQLARAKMVELCATISSGTLDAYPATDDPQACRYCAYHAACRERPAVAEDRFGR